jgi:hypothetical protein
MEFALSYPIVAAYLPAPCNRRRGWPLPHGVRFIVAHDTGNPGTTARQNVHYYASTPGIPASAHLFVDDRDIIECIPALTGAPEKAWHVRYGVATDNHLYGYNANDAALGIEYCYGGSIDANEAYRRYVWVIAYCCHRFSLDPTRAVVGHFMLDPQRKTDPVTGLAHSRRTYEQLLRDVVAVFRESLGVPPAAPSAKPAQGEVTVTCAVNLRRGYPHRLAPLAGLLLAGARIAYTGIVQDGEAINGNPLWFRDAEGRYFWGGATDAWSILGMHELHGSAS